MTNLMQMMMTDPLYNMIKKFENVYKEQTQYFRQ